MATKLAAAEDKLGLIHYLTAEYIKSRLEQAQETGEPIPPAELGAITKFLKDNGIECTKKDMNEKFGSIIALDVPLYEEIEADFG